MEHFTFLDTVSSKISKLEKEYSTIAQLYSVVKYYQIHISEEQIAVHKIFLTKFGQLKTCVKLSESNKDAAIAKFRDNLEAHVTGLRMEVSNLKAKVSFCFSVKINLILVSYKPNIPVFSLYGILGKKFNPNILKMEFTGRIFLICELEWEVKLHIYFTNL